MKVYIAVAEFGDAAGFSQRQTLIVTIETQRIIANIERASEHSGIQLLEQMLVLRAVNAVAGGAVPSRNWSMHVRLGGDCRGHFRNLATIGRDLWFGMAAQADLHMVIAQHHGAVRSMRIVAGDAFVILQHGIVRNERAFDNVTDLFVTGNTALPRL